jgi:tripartite-type tricarboxylate transporter receptor subunit TctC
MKRRTILAAAGMTAVLVAAAMIAPAQAQIGEQPIRVIFPFSAGASGDALSRLIAEKMRIALKRPVIVEDRTGAAGRIGTELVATAAPDGNTLLIVPIAPISIYPLVYKNLKYNPLTQLTPVAQLGTFEFGLAVAENLPVKTVKELVAWAKANPTKANYGIPAAGSLPHFLGAMFGQATGTDLRAVSYRGSAAALADVVAGHLPMIFTTISDIVPMAKAGRVRVLATSGKERSEYLPDVPTFTQAGYKLVASGWYGMFAPAKTPPEIIARYNKIVVDAIHSPEIKAKLNSFGLHPTGTSAAELGAIVKDDMAAWAPAVKASGFTPQK